MLKKFTSLLMGALILISSFVIIAQANTLYNIAYRNVPTLTGTTEYSTNTQLWRIVNGYKGTTSGHDFFQTKALATVDTQFELFFDLGSIFPVEKIVMRGGNSAYPVDFSFTTSETNNNDWTAFGSKTGHTVGYSETTLTHTAVNARYVKMIVTKSNILTPAISEIEIFSQIAPLSNIAIGSTAVFEGTTTVGTNIPANGVNGISALTASNDGTNLNLNQAQTSATTTTAWKYKVALQQFDSISKIVLVPGKSAYPTKYTIETSLDDRRWTPIVTQTAGTGSFVPITYNFSTIDAKFIRLNITESNSANPSISELEVFGVLSSNQTPPQTTKEMQLRKTVEASLPTQPGRELKYVNDGIVGTIAPVNNNFTQVQIVETTEEQDYNNYLPDEASYKNISWNMTIDLGRQLNMTTLKVVNGKSLFVKKYKLFTSSDKQLWTEVANELNGLGEYAAKTYELSAKTKARYVKFEALENSHWKPCISEIIVENNEPDNLPIFSPEGGTISGYIYKKNIDEFPIATLSNGTPEYFIAQQGEFGTVLIEGNNFSYITSNSDATSDIFKIGADNGNGDYSTYNATINLTKVITQSDTAFNKTVISSGDVECAYTYFTLDAEKANRAFIVALYDGNHMIDVKIPSSVNDNIDTTTRKAIINVPSGEGKAYKIKAFVWSNLENIVPHEINTLQ